MKLFKLVFLQWFIFIASYKFCRAVEYEFSDYVKYTLGVPSDVLFQDAPENHPEFEFKVALLIREEESDKFQIVRMKEATVEEEINNNYVVEEVYHEFLISQVEFAFSYTTIVNIIVTRGSVINRYHFQFDEEDQLEEFIAQISPVPTANDIKLLDLDIPEVTRVLDDFSHYPTTLVTEGAIYMKTIESENKKTFILRGPLENNVQFSYLIFRNNEFHVSQPFGTNKTKVLLFLSRAPQLKYIFNFNNEQNATDFTNNMLEFVEGNVSIPYHTGWSTY